MHDPEERAQRRHRIGQRSPALQRRQQQRAADHPEEHDGAGEMDAEVEEVEAEELEPAEPEVQHQRASGHAARAGETEPEQIPVERVGLDLRHVIEDEDAAEAVRVGQRTRRDHAEHGVEPRPRRPLRARAGRRSRAGLVGRGRLLRRADRGPLRPFHHGLVYRTDLFCTHASVRTQRRSHCPRRWRLGERGPPCSNSPRGCGGCEASERRTSPRGCDGAP